MQQNCSRCALTAGSTTVLEPSNPPPVGEGHCDTLYGRLCVQAVGPVVLRISIPLREMVNGTAGIIRPIEIRRRHRVLITKIEE